MSPPERDPTASTSVDLFRAQVRALKRYRARLARKLEGLRGDLEAAQRAPQFRRFGEALLAYMHQVPARVTSVTLPDPGHESARLDIPLDPELNPQTNAARYFKRAGKAERGIDEIPPRIVDAEREVRELTAVLERAASTEAAPDGAPAPDVIRAVEEALGRLPPALRRSLGGAPSASAGPAKKKQERGLPSRLQPRRLTNAEGWEVLIGRSNEGNDYLTHKLARGEDYWFHVHGAAGSHVVLRRGKGKNEPSKQTIEEVASWTAFYSQARTAGKVPVIFTRKKYVRKPRGSKPGLAVCEREKTVMVRPREPERSRVGDLDQG
jgi:predicted ribosome quality control (RQC) complex YloA/Tae2 family protein